MHCGLNSRKSAGQKRMSLERRNMHGGAAILLNPRFRYVEAKDAPVNTALDKTDSFFFSGLVPDRRSHIHTSYTQGGAAQACAPARNCLFVFLLPRRIKSQGACVHECVRVRARAVQP